MNRRTVLVIALTGLVIAACTVQLSHVRGGGGEAEPIVEPGPDPRQGKLVVRLIEADTGRLVVNTDCEMHRVEFFTTCIDYGFRYRDPDVLAVRTTDHDGKLELTAAVVEDLYDAGEDIEVAYVEGEGWRENEVQRFPMPLPKGWWPQTHCYELAKAMTRAFSTPACVDIKVCRSAELDLTFEGAERDGAKFTLYPLTSQRGHYAWTKEFTAMDWYTDQAEWEVKQLEHLAAGHARMVSAAFNETLLLTEAEIQRRELETERLERDARWAEEEGVEPRDLSRWTGLPCLRVGVVAWHPRVGVATATIELKPGPNRLDLRAAPALDASLQLNIAWHGTVPEAPVLTLSRTMPFGSWGLNEDPVYSERNEWRLPAAVDCAWRGSISGLAPGWWFVRCSSGQSVSSTRVLLKPGEALDAELAIGPAANARWKPEIRLDGRRWEPDKLLMLGGGEDSAEYLSLADGALELSPGTWTAWVPGVPPLTFDMHAREERAEVIDIPAFDTRVSIDQDLYDLVSGDEGAFFSLNGNVNGDAADSLAHAAGADRSKRLSPDAPLNLRLPVGTYGWNFGSAKCCAEWVVEIGPGSNDIHFGLDTMGGMNVVVLALEGFDEEDRLSVSNNGGPGSASSPVMNFDPRRWNRSNIVYPDEYPWSPWTDPCELEENSLFLVFTAQTPELVVVGAGGGTAEFWITGPTRLKVAKEDLKWKPATRVTVKHSEDDDVRGEKLIHAGGPGGTSVILDELNDTELAQGLTRFHVVRAQYQKEGLAMYDWAATTIEVTGETQELDFDDLDYQPCGELSLRISGQVSGAASDPFWMPVEEVTWPSLYALDETIQGRPRRLSIGRPGAIHPTEKPAMDWSHLVLPPGRYRIEPWPHAPEKFWRTVAISAGKRTEVSLELE